MAASDDGDPRRPAVEKGVEDGVAGRYSLFGSSERTRETQRSFWVRRGGEGTTMAAVVLVSGDGWRSAVRVGERPGEGEE